MTLRGYDRHEVEDRLREYREELQERAGDGGPVDADDLALLIRRRRFRTVAIGGYDPEEVEAFLDEIVARLRRR